METIQAQHMLRGATTNVYLLYPYFVQASMQSKYALYSNSNFISGMSNKSDARDSVFGVSCFISRERR